MNTKDPLKIVLGLILLVAGTVLAIRSYPAPMPMVLATVHGGVPLPPGQQPPQNGLPWEVFVGYFRTLLATMVLMHIGAILVYSGLVRPAADPRPS